jgi:hypothetical protein
MNRLKIVNAGQGVIHEYENTKRKLLICNANIYFNKQCHQKGFTPNYAKIRIPGNTPATISTMKKARLLRIKEELKFLHNKKTTSERKTIPDTPKSGKPMGKKLAVYREHIRFKTTHNSTKEIPKPQPQNTKTCTRTNNKTRETCHLLP